MLYVNHLFKSYGPSIVLNDVSFNLNPGDRFGLIGANGVGKTTLLRIIAGVENPDSGDVIVSPSTTIGYLSQTITEIAGQTIESFLMKAVGNLSDIENHMHRLEQAMAIADDSQLVSLITEYNQVSTKYNERYGYDVDYRIKKIMDGLGIGSLSRFRLVDTLSGGEKTRINLTSLLLQSPNLLLLDEPTNNLDIESLKWLESFMVKHRGAMITATHDRQFLNNTVNNILEIDEYTHRTKIYSGNYDAFRSVKEIERTKWEEHYQQQQGEITELRKIIKSAKQPPSHKHKSIDNDKYVPYFKGQRLQQAASRIIRNARERLLYIENNPIPRPPKDLLFRPNVKQPNIRSAQVIKVIQISKSYGEKLILDNISFTVSYNSRIVVTGPNGSGKSTLMGLLAGREIADRGQLVYSPNTRIGFLPQEPGITEHEDTMLNSFRHGLVGYEEDMVFDLVTCGLFRYEELDKKMGQLSVGQIRKFQIARIIAVEPDVLILDEPANHISLDVLESFEKALSGFSGPVISVSHDRRFIRQFGKEIWEINSGKLVKT